jgi:hypothetical protein
MGFLAGGSAKAATTVKQNPFLAPKAGGWFWISAMVTPAVAVVWVIYTFGAYSAKFGFMAIGEVLVGAFLAGLLSHEGRLGVTLFGLPAAIIAWIVL